MQELVLQDREYVQAPLERCFVLSTRIEIVQQTLGFTPEPAAGAVTAGSRVRWRGWLFGLPHEHHTLITAFDAPHFFEDSQERGRFAKFRHEHRFREVDGGTLMEDAVHFALPWWLGGALVAKWVMAPHIQRLLRARMTLLKKLAESDSDWVA